MDLGENFDCELHLEGDMGDSTAGVQVLQRRNGAVFARARAAGAGSCTQKACAVEGPRQGTGSAKASRLATCFKHKEDQR